MNILNKIFGVVFSAITSDLLVTVLVMVIVLLFYSSKWIHLFITRIGNIISELYTKSEDWFSKLSKLKFTIYGGLLVAVILWIVTAIYRFLDNLITDSFPIVFGIIIYITTLSFLIYLGRYLYKVIISRFFDNLNTRRKEAILEKYIIHMYFLNNDADWNEILSTLNIDPKNIEKKNIRSKVHTFKSYFIIFRKALMYIVWGFVFIVISFTFSLITLNTGGRSESNDLISVVIMLFSYIAIQLFFQGFSWIKPWALKMQLSRNLPYDEETINKTLNRIT